VIVAEGTPVHVASRVVGVSESGWYEWLKRPPSERSIRHGMLTDLIRQIHIESRGIDVGRRVQAELTLGRGIEVPLI
jgi:putative transposase